MIIFKIKLKEIKGKTLNKTNSNYQYVSTFNEEIILIKDD